MSALTPKADINRSLSHVRFVPIADISGSLRNTRFTSIRCHRHYCALLIYVIAHESERYKGGVVTKVINP
jgi:hypothetical protein